MSESKEGKCYGASIADSHLPFWVEVEINSRDSDSGEKEAADMASALFAGLGFQSYLDDAELLTISKASRIIKRPVVIVEFIDWSNEHKYNKPVCTSAVDRNYVVSPIMYLETHDEKPITPHHKACHFWYGLKSFVPCCDIIITDGVSDPTTNDFETKTYGKAKLEIVTSDNDAPIIIPIKDIDPAVTRMCGMMLKYCEKKVSI